jgi:hypothetical protein
VQTHAVSEHKKTGRFLEANPIEVEDGEFKAQAVTKLEERFKSMKNAPQTGVVSGELKQAIGEVLNPNLEQNRNAFLRLARDRIERPTRGFSGLKW